MNITDGYGTVFDRSFDELVANQTRIEREQQREEYGATCPKCGADILAVLLECAHDWSEGLPNHCAFECPKCELEIEYSIEWDYAIESATRTTPPFHPRATCLRCRGDIVAEIREQIGDTKKDIDHRGEKLRFPATCPWCEFVTVFYLERPEIELFQEGNA